MGDEKTVVRPYTFEVKDGETYADTIQRLGDEVGERFLILDDPHAVERLRACSKPQAASRREMTRTGFVAALVMASHAAQAPALTR